MELSLTGMFLCVLDTLEGVSLLSQLHLPVCHVAIMWSSEFAVILSKILSKCQLNLVTLP